MKIISLSCFLLLNISFITAQNYSLSNYNIENPYAQHNNGQLPGDSTIPENDLKPGIAAFVEFLGKGYISGNIDFRIADEHRAGFGLTQLDYRVYDTTLGNANEVHDYLCPGFMYYFNVGKNKNYLELGAGASFSLSRKWEYLDSPVTIHAVIGYRRQIKNRFLFRAGFTPLLQPPSEFLPLVGVSFGYSW